MLRGDQRDAWVHQHGPWLHWALFNHRVWPWILRDGIQPQEATGVAGMHSDMTSRPGHIYFMTQPTPAARFAAGVGTEPQVRVSLWDLDLECLATDEDRVGVADALSRHRQVVQQLPRWSELPERAPGMATGVWMNENADIVDQPEWVWHSMTELTVAYRGGVEAAQLEFLSPYLSDDWEPADEGEVYAEQPAGSPAKHYIGDPQGQPR